MRLQGLQAIAHLQKGGILYRETSFGTTAMSKNTIIYSDGEADKMESNGIIHTVISDDHWSTT